MLLHYLLLEPSYKQVAGCLSAVNTSKERNLGMLVDATNPLDQQGNFQVSKCLGHKVPFSDFD